MPYCYLPKAANPQKPIDVTVPSVYGDRISGSGRCSYSAGTLAASSLFYRLCGGRVIHNIPSLIFRSPMENSTARFATSSPSLGDGSLECPPASYT
jgi:hypothetical protein